MPYIDRNADGNIVGIYANPQREGHEFVDVAELWEPVVSPEKVTMRQAQEALLEDGTLDLVEATINSMTGIEGRRAKIQWTKSQDVYRNWPLVIQLGPVIGKTPEQLDALFIKASKL